MFFTQSYLLMALFLLLRNPRLWLRLYILLYLCTVLFSNKVLRLSAVSKCCGMTQSHFALSKTKLYWVFLNTLSQLNLYTNQINKWAYMHIYVYRVGQHNFFFLNAIKPMVWIRHTLFICDGVDTFIKFFLLSFENVIRLRTLSLFIHWVICFLVVLITIISVAVVIFWSSNLSPCDFYGFFGLAFVRTTQGPK